MKVVFTICSVNYLAGAKSLCKSLLASGSDFKFVYVIADRLESKISADFFEGEDYVEVENLQIPDLDNMIRTYNITEFNTSVKPFAFQYLHKKYSAEKIIYFDPDILVFKNLSDVWLDLDQYDFILTPHFLKPIVENEFYNHQVGALNTGVFNLGFIALRYTKASETIIGWWAHHMKQHGHSNSVKGEFYDQKIMNLLPVFSEKVKIEKNPGYNVAGWNIHERDFEKDKETYRVNGSDLVFYHYSGIFADAKSDHVSKYNGIQIKDKPFISELLNKYRNALQTNGHDKLKNLPCYFRLQPDIHKTSRVDMFTHKIRSLFK